VTHEHHFENVAPYLLEALPAREREAFERHMETCARCRDEVAHLRLAADALPHAVEPQAPPPELKAALMEVVEREAAARAPRAERAPARRRVPWRERLALPRLRPAALAFGAASVLALGVGLGYGLSGDGGDASPRTVAGSVAGVTAGRATVTIPGDGGHAVLRVRGMPDPGPNSTYQVWLSRDGRVTSQSLFTVGRDGTGAAAVPDPVAGADAVMVTREPAGGSPAPTARPIVTVAL